MPVPSLEYRQSAVTSSSLRAARPGSAIRPALTT